MTTSLPFPRRRGMRVSFGLAFAIIAAFGLVPAVAVIVISFTDIRGLPGLPVNWVGLENYVTFFSAAHMRDNLNAIVNTAEYAISTTVLQIVLGLGIALLLNRAMAGRSFFRAIVFLPTVLGVTVIGLIWSLIFNPSGGPAQEALRLLGVSSAFFGDPRLALPLVIFVQVWSVVGIAVVIFLAGLQAIPPELTEAAAIDGASGWQRMWQVTIPMLAPSITTNVILGIVNSMQSYQLAYVLTGTSNRATQLLSTEVYVQGFGGALNTGVSQSQGYAATISVIQFIIVGVVALVLLAYLRKREERL